LVELVGAQLVEAAEVGEVVLLVGGGRRRALGLLLLALLALGALALGLGPLLDLGLLGLAPPLALARAALLADPLDRAQDRAVLARVDVALLQQDLVEPDQAVLGLVHALLLAQGLVDPLRLADVALGRDLAVEAVRLAHEVVD